MAQQLYYTGMAFNVIHSSNSTIFFSSLVVRVSCQEVHVYEELYKGLGGGGGKLFYSYPMPFFKGLAPQGQ